MCISLNILATMFPALGYVLPALAGLAILIQVFESGYNMAGMVYFSASVLSMALCADKLPALAFLSLFGFYPIIKVKIDCKFSKNKILKIALKCLVFNLAVVTNWWVSVKLFNVPEEAFYIFDFYMPSVLWGIANVMFLMYDKCVNDFIKFYISFLQPKIRKMIKV